MIAALTTVVVRNPSVSDYCVKLNKALLSHVLPQLKDVPVHLHWLFTFLKRVLHLSATKSWRFP